MVPTVSYVVREEASSRLATIVRALQEDDSLAPVTVVVPSARAALFLPGALGAHGRRGLANVNFITLARLAEGVGAPSLEAALRRRLTRTTLAAAVRSALASSGRSFGPATAHAATSAEVTDRYEELRFAGVIGGQSVDAPALSRRARGLMALCGQVREMLRSSTYDDVDLFESATAALRAGDAEDLGAVVVYLPERCRSTELSFLRVLGLLHPTSVLLGLSGDEEGDAPSRELARRIAAALNVVTPAPPAEMPARPVANDRLLVAPNPRAEVRGAVRLVLDQLAAGSRPERIALLYAVRDPYLRLVVAELAQAGVAFSAPTPDPLSAAVPGRVLAALFELAGPTMRRESLMRLLRSGPILGPSGELIAVAEWDRVSRVAGIAEGSRSSWTARLSETGRRAQEARGRARDRAGSSSDGSDVVVEDRTARAARELSEFVGSVAELLVEGARLRGWGALTEWARGCLDTLLGGASATLDWPLGARESYEMYQAIFDELALLDEVEPGITLSGFGTRVREELRRPGPRVGGLGRGIAVGALELLAGADVDLAIVLGCSASNLPATAGRSPLLEGADRDALGLDPLSSRAAAVRVQHQLGMIRGAARQMIVTLPELDVAGRPVAVSRFVETTRERGSLPGDAGALAGIASGGTARTVAELETAVLFEAASDAQLGELDRFGLDELGAPMRAVRERDRGAFGAYAGLIGPSTPPSGGVTPFSPTSLEAIASCPFRHFLDHVLSCEVLEEPERRIEIDPRDRGIIVHEVLERFVAEEVESIIPLTTFDREGRLAAIAEEVISRFERMGRTGKKVVFELERRRILEGLEIDRRADEARRAATGARPVAVEHGFGFGAVPPVVLDTGAKQVAFRGMIDRIDENPDGSLVVLDYKTGRPDSFAGIVDDPIDGGRHLQLPIYALAARAHLQRPTAAVRAAFRFVGPVSSEIAVELDASLEARLSGAIEVLTDTIDSGVFPMRPGDTGFGGWAHCRYCDFDSVCPPDRSRYFDHAALSGRIDRYLQLTDEEQEVDDDA